MAALKLSRMGNSVGLTLPMEVLSRLKPKKGDTVTAGRAGSETRGCCNPRWPGRSVLRPMARPNLADLSASCGVRLARNHPFVQGNRRAEFLAVGLLPSLMGDGSSPARRMPR